MYYNAQAYVLCTFFTILFCSSPAAAADVDVAAYMYIVYILLLYRVASARRDISSAIVLQQWTVLWWRVN